MSVVTAPRDELCDQDFRHEAYFYAGLEGFVDGALAFIEEGLAADEPIMVAVSDAKIEALRSALAAEAARVSFVDMRELGRNPARIIPAWRSFLDDEAPDGRRIRGIGEPIWATRSSAELVECQRHESLLNVAFSGVPDFWLLCPYDVEGLDAPVLDEARRSHPFLLDARGHRPSGSYPGVGRVAAHADPPLPEPPVPPVELAFHGGEIGVVRETVARHAAALGMDPDLACDLVVAVNEVATNTVQHGGGRGRLRLWDEPGPPGAIVCEVRDRGYIDQPLVGRERPSFERTRGRGLWLANQLCDLVQIRSSALGTVVRMRLTLA